MEIPVLVLDGDVFRSTIGRDLGFSQADRTENIRRAAEVANLARSAQICVLAAFITPLARHRTLVREIIGTKNISLVHAKASVDSCRRRDIKGLYARADAGELLEMTGVTSLFEEPDNVDLTLPTSSESPSDSTDTLVRYILEKLDGSRLFTLGAKQKF